MKLIKDGDIVDLLNKGTIDAYKAAGYVEYIEPPKPIKKQEKKEKE